MLNKRYNKRLNEKFVVLNSISIFWFQFLFCQILERKDKTSFKRHICCFIFFSVFLDLISILVFLFYFHSISYRFNDLLYRLNDIICR